MGLTQVYIGALALWAGIASYWDTASAFLASEAALTLLRGQNSQECFMVFVVSPVDHHLSPSLRLASPRSPLEYKGRHCVCQVSPTRG